MAVKLQVCINQLTQACYEMGVEQAVISPGSRNAPLTVAFARHPHIKCRSVIDERSAAFVALGMAQKSQKPVVIICTSGTAVLNFYSAIAEAYYQNIPLIVLTADRPSKWIGQWDGQTINQRDVFLNHVRASFSLPTDNLSDNLPEKIIEVTEQAINTAMQPAKGPVHINLPFAEPFYPTEEYGYEAIGLKPKEVVLPISDKEGLQEVINANKNILVVNGANVPDNTHKLGGAVILSDVVSNQLAGQNIDNWESILTISNDELKAQLKPDVLITTGTAVVSKNLKLFLRANKPQHHFHISETGQMADPFETNPTLVSGDVSEVLNNISINHNDYLATWQNISKQVSAATDNYFTNSDYSEITAAKEILNKIPSNSILHLANSMPVRYVNTLAEKLDGIEVYSNRGTSGIDGCTSTAVGAALMTNKLVTLITGDVAFFYDANGLWNKHLPKNLRIIVMNNGGGGIFRLIEGPSKLAELEEFFETEHNRTGEGLAKEHDLEYNCSRNFEELDKQLSEFFVEKKRPAILEVFTDKHTNEAVFKGYKEAINGIEI